MKGAIRATIAIAALLSVMAICVGARADDYVVCKEISTGDIEIFQIACPVGWQRA